MKRILVSLGIFSVILFGIFEAISAFTGNLPVLLSSAVAGYKFNRGLLWFIQALPAVLLTGFLVGACVQWKNAGSNSEERFSQAMMERFRIVLLIGLGVVLIVTACREIAVPSINRKQQTAEQNPGDLTRDVFLADYYLRQNSPNLAWQYAERAYAIDPQDKDALRVYHDTHEAMEITLNSLNGQNAQDEESTVTIEKPQLPIAEEDMGWSPKELMEKSRKAAAEKRWFDSHYWATLAVQATNETENLHTLAIEAANEAWNRMSSPDDFNNEAEKAYYQKKKEGYAALNYGDFLTSYYIFLGLSKESAENAHDPDVIRYLALSKERLENQYFFIDEADDLENRDSVSDVYFSLKNTDGSTDVIYIDRMTTLREDGGLVRYLQNFTMIDFTRTGAFSYCLHVPFAKVVTASVSVFDAETAASMGLHKKWKEIPEVYLQAVDRNTEGIISKPSYYFVPGGMPELLQKKLGMEMTAGSADSIADYTDEEKEKIMGTRLLFLPMPFSDFDLLGDVSKGAGNMNLLLLNNFIDKADRYGFASEVYIKSLVTRGTFPLLMLIFVIFDAVVAWNYRLMGEKTMFKFGWIIFLPLLFVMIYFLYMLLTYVSQILNFVLTGFCGEAALLVGFIIYAVLFFLVSLLFLARKS